MINPSLEFLGTLQESRFWFVKVVLGLRSRRSTSTLAFKGRRCQAAGREVVSLEVCVSYVRVKGLIIRFNKGGQRLSGSAMYVLGLNRFSHLAKTGLKQSPKP